MRKKIAEKNKKLLRDKKCDINYIKDCKKTDEYIIWIQSNELWLMNDRKIFVTFGSSQNLSDDPEGVFLLLQSRDESRKVFLTRIKIDF